MKNEKNVNKGHLYVYLDPMVLIKFKLFPMRF